MIVNKLFSRRPSGYTWKTLNVKVILIGLLFLEGLLLILPSGFYSENSQYTIFIIPLYVAFLDRFTPYKSAFAIGFISTLIKWTWLAANNPSVGSIIVENPDWQPILRFASPIALAGFVGIVDVVMTAFLRLIFPFLRRKNFFLGTTPSD